MGGVRAMSVDDTLRTRLIALINRLGPEDLLATDEFLSQLVARPRTSVNATTARPLSGAPTAESSAAPRQKAWPHAPLHRLGDAGTYLVTAGTWHKAHHFRGGDRLQRLEDE